MKSASAGDSPAEPLRDLSDLRRGVLDRVVEPGGGDHLFVAGNGCHQPGHPFEVNAVGCAGVLAAMVGVTVGFAGKCFRLLCD